jgi:hypothetical protein
MLAHAGGAPETLSVVFLFGGIWVGWAGWSRIKGRGFPRLPMKGAYALMVGAVGLALCAAVVPPLIWGPALKLKPPVAASVRPASTASIHIVKPKPGQTLSGPTLDIVMTLPGGTIVDYTSTKLTTNTGHIHILVDGKLISMTYGLVQEISLQGLKDGPHTLTATFVAADHGPFNPPVSTSLTFTKAGSG